MIRFNFIIKTSEIGSQIGYLFLFYVMIKTTDLIIFSYLCSKIINMNLREYLQSMPKLMVETSEIIATVNTNTGLVTDYPNLFPEQRQLVVMTKSDYLRLCYLLNESLKGNQLYK